MKKILASKWFLAVAGAVAFGVAMVVMVLLQKPEEPAQASAGHPAGGTNTVSGTNTVAEGASSETNAPAEHAVSEEGAKPARTPSAPATTAFLGAVGEPGSLSFQNQDIKPLLDELRRERSALLARETQLKELERRLALEKAEIGAITQEVLRAKATLMAGLTNQMTIRDKTEEGRLRDLARVYTNMVAASAVQILKEMDDDDVAKILQFMDAKDQAAILENFATNEVTKAAGKATEISQKIRKLAEKPVLPTRR